ncbi:MAG: phosphoribosylamine--glycine ligase [Pelagibacteraceae bacterium TMED232]|nr:MAG: phosphoribosylamine--glycine ligase [Pelagibacteraceae bacterium TMED232]|tara:strand:+ start:3101 stop:4363 length:1263 start_codon:yes stop_codon:yes gene_type:complete
MKVGIIGSGGREHAFCESLKKSKIIEKIYCFPGNAGTSQVAENVEIDLSNFENIKNFTLDEKIDFLIIGPEKPLVDGIVDYLEKHNIKVFGPNKFASQLEGSKIFTKKLCQRFNIPTAKFGIFFNSEDAEKFLQNSNYPIVIKADGLAAGKGVYISETNDQAKIAVKEIFDGKFGLAKQLLIEEFLSGEEMSFFIISDGKNYKQFGTAQDHKRVLEGDKGKNTGGMGAYSPSRLENEVLNKKIIDKIIEPTLKGLKDKNSIFKGFLYAGLIIIKGEPFLIEYNVRMGDPECQTLLPKLKTDFGLLINACLNENLKNTNIEWHNDKSLCVVMCSKGYPDEYNNNIELNLNNLKLDKNDFLFHAGTKYINGKTYSNGGRVLNIVIRSNNFKSARDKALRLLANLDWKSGFYRKDIGHKVIDQ